MNRANTFEFFRRLAEDNPSPETELLFGNTYQLLVAVVLSAQSTDVGVNKATRALFRNVTKPPQMVGVAEQQFSFGRGVVLGQAAEEFKRIGALHGSITTTALHRL